MVNRYKYWLESLTNFCQLLIKKGLVADDLQESTYDTALRLFFIKLFSEIKDDPTQRKKIVSYFENIRVMAIINGNSKIMQEIELPELIDPEFPGILYGEFLNYELEFSENRVSLSSIKARRKHGAYYTPPEVVKYIVENAIKYYLKKPGINNVSEIKICDPAMGTGRFLIEAANKLTTIIYNRADHAFASKDEVYRTVVRNCIFGIDKDPIATAVTKSYFLVTSGEDSDELQNFLLQDSLLDAVPDSWKFDIVVGNPPWGTFGLRNVSAISPELGAAYREKYPNTAEYKLSIYSLFIEKAIALTKKGGVHSFIVPDSWLNGRYFKKLREYLLSSTSFLEIVLIIKDFWKRLNIGRSTIYFVRNEVSAKQQKIGTLNLGYIDELKLMQKKYLDVPLANINQRERKRIILYPDKKSQKLVEQMESAPYKMENFVRFYSGLIGKKGKNSIVFDKVTPEFCSEQRSMLIESGSNLERDRLVFNGCYIMHDPALYKSGYKVENYAKPKIFLNQTGYELKAFYDTFGLYCLNNMHIGYKIHDDIDLRFITFLLNSRLMNFYYKIMSMEHGRVLAQTDIDFLHQLPLAENNEIVDEAVAILDKHQKRDYELFNANHIEYRVNLPKEYERQMEALIAKWYGVDAADV